MAKPKEQRKTLSPHRPKIVTIGGGTGSSTVLRGLRKAGGRDELDITAVVSMMDHGSSSGLLRDRIGILPPGDIWQALVALSSDAYRSEILRDFLTFRWKREDDPESLRGHSGGNAILTGIQQITGNWLETVRGVEIALGCEGRVLPVTVDPVDIVAETNQRKIHGEGRIDEFVYEDREKEAGEHIVHVWLEPVPHLLEQARDAIQSADLVVVGPGSFYTSLVACLKVKGMLEALANTAHLAYVVNLTTVPRETQNWKVSDFVARFEDIAGREVDTVICNTELPEELQAKYRRENQEMVRVDIPAPDWVGRTVIADDFVYHNGEDELARHDPEKLGRAIASLVSKEDSDNED